MQLTLAHLERENLMWSVWVHYLGSRRCVALSQGSGSKSILGDTTAAGGRNSWMKKCSLLRWGSRWFNWNIWTEIFVKGGGWVSEVWNKLIQPLMGKLLSNILFTDIIRATWERIHSDVLDVSSCRVPDLIQHLRASETMWTVRSHSVCTGSQGT